MNEYQTKAVLLIKQFSTDFNWDGLYSLDMALLFCDKLIEEWQHITDTFVSGSVTNVYRLDEWQKVREILLQQKQAQDERES